MKSEITYTNDGKRRQDSVKADLVAVKGPLSVICSGRGRSNAEARHDLVGNLYAISAIMAEIGVNFEGVKR